MSVETDNPRREIATRVETLIRGAGRTLENVARAALGQEGGILSSRPTAIWADLLTRACVAAGGRPTDARWAATGVEITMAAADIFDDVADGEPSEALRRYGPGALLTTAAGLLSLGTEAMLRSVEDGVSEHRANLLARVLARGFAAATDGQTASLLATGQVRDVGEAYRLAAGKSGPLGEIDFRVGAMVASTDADVINSFGIFGWHFAVYSQLLNDGRDVLPDGPTRKLDVRVGASTVPLVFAGSTGAPAGLDDAALQAWEQAERRRVAEVGGLITTELLANAERQHAAEALDALTTRGLRVDALRELLLPPTTWLRIANTRSA